MSVQKVQGCELISPTSMSIAVLVDLPLLLCQTDWLLHGCMAHEIMACYIHWSKIVPDRHSKSMLVTQSKGAVTPWQSGNTADMLAEYSPTSFSWSTKSSCWMQCLVCLVAMNAISWVSAVTLTANSEGLVLKINKLKLIIWLDLTCRTRIQLIVYCTLQGSNPSLRAVHLGWELADLSKNSCIKASDMTLLHCYLLAERGLLRRCGATSTSWLQEKKSIRIPKSLLILVKW